MAGATFLIESILRITIRIVVVGSRHQLQQEQEEQQQQKIAMTLLEVMQRGGGWRTRMSDGGSTLARAQHSANKMGGVERCIVVGLA